MRITIGKSDYAFRILNPDPPSKASTEIEVEVDGKVLTLVRRDRSWICLEPPEDEMEEVAEAIGKAIALRYRI